MAEKNIRFKDANGNYLYPRAKVGNIIDASGTVVDFSLFAKKAELTPLVTKTELNEAVGSIVTFSVSVVQSLPATSEASTKVIYLVPSNEGTNNSYIEYLFVNGVFEKIGTTNIDLTGYATTANLTAEITNLTKTDGTIDTKIKNYAYSKSEIDNKISAINAAVGALTYEEIS